jgi:hypothetical protein
MIDLFDILWKQCAGYFGVSSVMFDWPCTVAKLTFNWSSISYLINYLHLSFPSLSMHVPMTNLVSFVYQQTPLNAVP